MGKRVIFTEYITQGYDGYKYLVSYSDIDYTIFEKDIDLDEEVYKMDETWSDFFKMTEWENRRQAKLDDFC